MLYAKNTKKVKVEPLFLKNYLEFAKRTEKSNLFRNFYAKVNGAEEDVLRNGRLACGIHVSTILKLFSLVGERQLTVHRTLDDMRKHGWYKIKTPKVGCVVLWAAKPADKKRMQKDSGKYMPMVRHLGIYIGNNQAISNRSDLGETPRIHSLRYQPIETFFWHTKLNKQ